MARDLAVQRAIVEAMESRQPAALATVVRTGGSTPQEAGARLLLRCDGSTVGTVGGGAVEHAIREALVRCLEDGKPRLATFELARDLGMCCGGRMEVFVERIEAQERLVIFGAGHVAEATAGFAHALGMKVVVVDEREELNNAVRFPHATRLHLTPDEALRELSPSSADWFLITTHDHQLDAEALDAVLRGPHRYAGLIGSERKVIRLLERVAERSHALGRAPSFERVYAPVGLAIGAVSPAEIGVAVAAEITALRHGHAAEHLRAVGRAPVLEAMARLGQGAEAPARPRGGVR